MLNSTIKLYHYRSRKTRIGNDYLEISLVRTVRYVSGSTAWYCLQYGFMWRTRCRPSIVPFKYMFVLSAVEESDATSITRPRQSFYLCLSQSKPSNGVLIWANYCLRDEKIDLCVFVGLRQKYQSQADMHTCICMCAITVQYNTMSDRWICELKRESPIVILSKKEKRVRPTGAGRCKIKHC